MIDYKDYQQIKWLSIYGASVAIQCHQRMIDGHGGDLSEVIESIKEDAAAVADWAMEGEAK
jgi:hypothetical protein